MAEIKTVERVRLGEWDAQKDQEHGRGKGSLKLRLTSASNKIIQVAPVIGPAGVSITLASGKSLRGDLKNTGNSTDRKLNRQAFNCTLKTMSKNIYRNTIYNSSILETTQMSICSRTNKYTAVGSHDGSSHSNENSLQPQHNSKDKLHKYTVEEFPGGLTVKDLALSLL